IWQYKGRRPNRGRLVKLLFLENRYATWLWREVAVRLQRDGHEIQWLVQNPVFTPNVGKCHKLPFPRGRRNGASKPHDIPLLASDRAVRFFGISNEHYAPSRSAIASVLDAIHPQVIFGEPTQFHELITIAESRRRGINSLVPASTRYPPGRLQFQLYDSLN